MSGQVVLENENIILKLFTYGATLSSFYIKPIDTDIVIGFDEVEPYTLKSSASMGKSVGRCANRIGDAKFSLNNINYNLLANNGPNCLHGGEIRFSDVEWNIKEQSIRKVIFTYDSPDMESGFPGNLHVEAEYELVDNELILTYRGISDKDTIFNMTNHSYFNLSKVKDDILNHELKIDAERINLNDENGMAIEKTIKVDGTVFDFRNFKEIGEAVSANGILLNQYCCGIRDGIINSDESDKRLLDNLDTNYLYENMNLKTLCELKDQNIKVEVKSDLPCVQIYTGKQLNVDGRDGHYGPYAGVAIEPQFCPNAINYSSFIKPIMKANEEITHVIKYKVTW